MESELFVKQAHFSIFMLYIMLSCIIVIITIVKVKKNYSFGKKASA